MVKLVNGERAMLASRCVMPDMMLDLNTNANVKKQYQLACKCC